MNNPKSAIEAEKCERCGNPLRDRGLATACEQPCPSVSEATAVREKIMQPLREGKNVSNEYMDEVIAQALHSSRRAAWQKCLDAVPSIGANECACEDRQCHAWNRHTYLRSAILSAALQHGFTLNHDGKTLE